MTKIPFRTAYGPRTPVTFKTDEVSLTHQSMSKECDINRIMLRFEKTGILEHRNTFEGQYGDFTGLPQDYHESMNAVLSANDMFGSLPAKLRRRFGNDPGSFIDFVADPSNKEELVKLGLAKPPETSEVLEDVKTPEPTPEAAPAAVPTKKSPE